MKHISKVTRIKPLAATRAPFPMPLMSEGGGGIDGKLSWLRRSILGSPYTSQQFTDFG